MKKMIDVDFGSSRYDELVELRYKVLLEPLGLKFLDSFRDKEATCISAVLKVWMTNLSADLFWLRSMTRKSV